MRNRFVVLLVLLFFTGNLLSIDRVPELVSPTVAPSRGFAQLGDVIGPITANGTTTAFRITKIQPDHKVVFQIWGPDFDSAAVTGEMRICIKTTAILDCPFIVMPNTTWPITDDVIIGSIQAYGPETEFRLNVAGIVTAAEIYFFVRQ